MSDNWLTNARMLQSRLQSRSRVETFAPGSIVPELLRRSEELLGEGIKAVELLEHYDRVNQTHLAGSAEKIAGLEAALCWATKWMQPSVVSQDPDFPKHQATIEAAVHSRNT